MSFSKSNPQIVAVPLVGARIPVSIFKVVDFPAPLGPRNPTICPAGISSESASTAVWLPNLLVSFCREIIMSLLFILQVWPFGDAKETDCWPTQWQRPPASMNGSFISPSIGSDFCFQLFIFPQHLPLLIRAIPEIRGRIPLVFQYFSFSFPSHFLLTFDLSCFPKKLWYSASLRRPCAPLFDMLRWERKAEGKAEIHPPSPRLWRTRPPSQGYGWTRRAQRRQHPSCTCIVLLLRVLLVLP